jgi:hypothetical protein
MPAYEYDLTDAATGEPLGTVTLHRPVDLRDSVVLTRRTVPRAVAAPSARPDSSPGGRVLAAWHRQECRDGSRLRLGGFTKRQIRALWAD